MKPTARRRAARPSGAHMGEEHLTLTGQSAAGAASRRAMAPARPGASFRQVRDEGRGSRASTPEISSPGPRRPPPRVSRSRSRSAGWWVGHATTAWRVGRKRFGESRTPGMYRNSPRGEFRLPGQETRSTSTRSRGLAIAAASRSATAPTRPGASSTPGIKGAATSSLNPGNLRASAVNDLEPPPPQRRGRERYRRTPSNTCTSTTMTTKPATSSAIPWRIIAVIGTCPEL